jgi:pimeloyl-ACP methyl ester carboxylesterase
VLPKLARHYTVLAPDLLGHGRSDKPRGDYSVGAHANTIRDLMDALGYRRATFVGHSLGCGVALQIAYQYPERIDRLVLVAPGASARRSASCCGRPAPPARAGCWRWRHGGRSRLPGRC